MNSILAPWEPTRWACSPALVYRQPQGKTNHSSASTAVEGALLKGIMDTPEPVLLPFTWTAIPHNQEDTDPANSPRAIRFHRHSVSCFTSATLMGWYAALTLSQTLLTGGKKKIYIHYKWSHHIQCGHKSVHTLLVFGIRNFFLALLYLAVRICPQHLICSPWMPRFLWQLFCSCSSAYILYNWMYFSFMWV